MICHGCGNTKAYGIETRYDNYGGKIETCNLCGAFFGASPDVYFKGEYVDEHLSSPEFPNPKRIRSKEEKKMWLKKCNLQESGDRVHGATSFDKISHRHGIESLRRKNYEGREVG